MSGSDYSGSDFSGSDDEYVGPKGGGASAAAARKMVNTQLAQTKKPERKAQAWERRKGDSSEEEEYIPTFEEIEDNDVPETSIQHMEEERKRKRLRKDTKPFQRGIIRHVVLVLDLSEAMSEKDMFPTRFHAMIQYAQEYVREFFEQNPISQMSVLGMHDSLCVRSAECTGAGESNAIPHPEPWNARSHRRVWLIIVRGPRGHSSDYQSLSTRPHSLATDQEHLRELLFATTTPPVVRATKTAQESARGAPPPEHAAALMMMGFPSRVVEENPTMCACHGALTTGGYTCSRCSAKVCSLPITCPSCQLTLLLSTHLARSYHHLFPLRNWAEVTWQRAREKGSKSCLSCLTPFPEIPPGDVEGEQQANGDGVDGQMRSLRLDEKDSDVQKASESSRYECRVCESHFCIDCDMFCHMVLHNCPGCLSKFDTPEMQNGHGDSPGAHQRRSYANKRFRKMSLFQRLIRFESNEGHIHYGDFGSSELPRDVSGKTVQLLSGSVQSGFSKTDKQATIKKLLPPLPSTPIFLCVGLNYKQHAEEGGLSIPTYPTIFMKPPTALSGPGSVIEVHKECQSQLDYEGELTIVIGKTGKNIAAADYADYVLGYTVGNDVSARNFQLPASVSGGQFGYAKSFDGFAPIGPCIASKEAIGGDPNKIRYWTKVNGETRQETGTDDMIWSVGQIVEHLSRGTTLQAGTCIMTGTPSGVGVFMEPKGFVKDGDEVEIYVEGIGSLVNTIKFE
ncbi:fumarylacetoacetate hydrolase family protein [Paraphaeosphaeria minitans]|uniref:Fumarylacetoacetate hydrolase family protein n=1 Tax=Paraphaeosphaeria minitans TaxID=565426 RepID=A0A9P6KLU8_9PLEO|nr:fumarylacetoacetate hydrolase family protein [Paraphaeosphaeria minitans]